MASYREYYSLTGDEVEQFGGAFKTAYNANGYALELDNGTDMACASYGAWAAMKVIESMRDMGAIKDHREMLNRWSYFMTNGG